MALTITTSLMGLVLPVPGPNGQVGPTWAQNINDAFTALDQHNHAPGSGSQITPAGINVNSDMDFKQFNMLNVKSLRLYSQTATLSGTGDKSCVYVVSGNLYFNNSAGTAVQITSGGAINVGALGTITGDYSSSGATVSYTNSTKVYSFLTATSTIAAKIVCSDISIYEGVASGQSVTLKTPTGLGSSYVLVFPTVLPASTLPLLIDSSGNMSLTTIGSSQISDNSVITSKILDANVTLAKLAAAVQQALVPSGSVIDFGGYTAPTGWLLCDGSAVSRSTYAALFAVIGTQFGVGDGSTTFNLPPDGVFYRALDSSNGSRDPDVLSRTAFVSGTHTLAASATTSGSPTITVSSTVNLAPGMSVSGGTIPAGAYVKQILSSTTFQLGDQNKAALNASGTSASTTLTFSKSSMIGYVGSYQADQNLSHSHNQQVTQNVGGGTYGMGNSSGLNQVPQSGPFSTGLSGGSQANPRNVYINRIIKT